jgi:polyribonucleotide nucleotidyltransferase
LYEYQRCFLQYDFPPYSTGSIPTGSGASLSSSNSNRRSIGHGKLAERAILAVLPPPHEFPYAIRVTSEVTDSNGSSSMASVCGASLALLDAGVPLRLPVAGASVGLVRDEANQCRLLIDITGTEDHYGLMDMKVAGTTQGVTALQLDVKEPLPLSVVLDALALAKSGREAILKETENLLGGPLLPRPSPKASAPRATIVRFDPQRKRDLVGPGGAVLRQMEDRYGVSLDLTQEGQCLIFGPNPEAVARARRTVMDLVADVVEGEVYTGVVVEIKDFGAIVELLRNKEGLLHVSEISHEEGDASDPRRHRDGVPGFLRRHLRVGQEIEVMCIGVDRLQGTIKLSRKALFRRRTSQ